MSDFKSALLTLGDDAFFELVRNYLGPIRTPFNKHDLIDRLERFLKHEETQDRIIALVDDEDVELISAVALLDAPAFDEIMLLFSQDRSYLDLHQRLLNLEDRLILYRDGEHLRLNPIMEKRLRRTVVSAVSLFPSVAVDEDAQPPDPPWLTDTLLISIYSWSYERPELTRADGTLRKRARADIQERLPILAEPPRAEVIVGALLALGALVEEGGLYPVSPVWHAMAKMTPQRRMATLVAAYATAGETNVGSLADAIEAVLDLLPGNRRVDPITVERLLLVLATDQNAEVCRRTREALTLVGALVADDRGLVRAGTVAPSSDAKTPLVIQPNLDVMLPQELAFDDSLFVAQIAKLTRHDRYPHFELTKARLADALRDEHSIDSIIERFSGLADARVPQNVVMSLRSWACEYESVRLYRGVVLTIESARRHMIEHASVRSLIAHELAPGVYLVDERHVDALRAALEEAGVELPPELAPAAAMAEAGADGSIGALEAMRERVVDKRRLASLRKCFTDDDRSDTTRANGADAAWREEIQERLKNGDLTSEQREELSTRVRQKLILSADQIDPASLKSEKTEARGLDYVGKVRIIEQAIRSGTSCVEVIERGSDGSPHRTLVDPIEMAKRGNELVLLGSALPDRTDVELLVRKLGLVRRVRSGLVRRRPLGR